MTSTLPPSAVATRWLTRPNVTWLTAALAAMAGLQLALAARYFTHLWVA